MLKAHHLSSLALSTVLAVGCARVADPDKRSAAQVSRNQVELVVYSQNFGMIRDTRTVDLAEGRSKIGLTGVSKALDQNSVVFSWPKKDEASIVSTTYDLGMADSDNLLKRFLGKEVELVYRGQDGKVGERVNGTLQIAEPGNVVIKSEGKYIVNPVATIEAPTDSGIVTIPQLTAEVDSKKAGSTELALAYLTTGLSWSADYTLTLPPGSETAGFECWASVTNLTGTDYPDAKISFVAGSPNRAVRSMRGRAYQYGLDAEAKADMSGFSAREASGGVTLEPYAMGELYAYPYTSTATIRQDQMNRVRMMGTEKLGIKRVYSVALPVVYRDYAYFGNPDHRTPATLGMNFKNSMDSGLGLPLPAGAVRVYEPDGTGNVRYIGAASISDTPKDARVNLTLTNVFDVYARVRQVSAKKVDKKHISREVEITISNEKKATVELRLVQSFGGTWKIQSESAKSQKLNSSLNQWTVSIPASGEVKLRYSVLLG